ncbi:MAG: hypothetical protein LC647_14305, partial [Beggiatoa sp.]|nr:hypothetical protein [Beggiatoa sp.]
GNPLLITWVVKQLGRADSQCRTLTEASAFLRQAPPGNDPLEYVFGDLLDTFTVSETEVLAALAHFTQPATVPWIADLAQMSERQAQTALEDLHDRALLISDPEARTFLVPPLFRLFLRRKRPEIMAATGERLADRAYALALENGYENHARFPQLEAEWPLVEAALPMLLQRDNALAQTLCRALDSFLNFSGRWDERLGLSHKAEEKALAAGDPYNAGWRAYQSGWIYSLRGQPVEVLDCARRASKHRENAQVVAREKAFPVRLCGIGHQLEGDHPAAIAAHREVLELWRTLSPESADVATGLNE